MQTVLSFSEGWDISPSSQPKSPLQAKPIPSRVISHLISRAPTGEAAKKGGSWHRREGERTEGRTQMAEKQINFSGRAHCWRPRAVPGSMAGHRCGSEVKGKGILQPQGETPATVTLSRARCHFCCPHGTTGIIPILQMGNLKQGDLQEDRAQNQTPADGAFRLAWHPCKTAARRNFTEGFDAALTPLSPAFSLPTSPIFSSLPLPQDSACTLNNTRKPSVLTSSPEEPPAGLAGGWQMRSEAQAGQGRQRRLRRAARLPPRSLAPHFVRGSKAPFLLPLPHHLLAKPCLRKGFCRLTSDSVFKRRCNLHFHVVPG